MNQLDKFCESKYLLQVDAVYKVDDKLKNIGTGFVASDDVNIICVRFCGKSVLRKMEGLSPLSFTFKKIMQNVQIQSSSSILEKKTDITLDPEPLFQRLLAVNSNDDFKIVL